MAPQTIQILVQTLGPLIIPLIANALTWLFNKGLGAITPSAQTTLSPFLPVLAGAIGTALGVNSGAGALSGMVSGLAATGLHQAVTQPIKAAQSATPK